MGRPAQHNEDINASVTSSFLAYSYLQTLLSTNRNERNFPFYNYTYLFHCTFFFSFLLPCLHLFFPACSKRSKLRMSFKDVGLFLRTLGNYCVIKNVHLQFSPLIMFNFKAISCPVKGCFNFNRWHCFSSSKL